MPQSVVGCSSLFDFKPESCGKERGNLGYLMDVAKQVFLQLWTVAFCQILNASLSTLLICFIISYRKSISEKCKNM